MAGLPESQHTTAAAIYAHYERQAAAEPPRAHLGASIIGHECERYLWLSFRWCGAEPFDGRMLRLFDTGKREEERIVAELRAIGCEVTTGPAPGEQWRFSACGDHFGGSMDFAVRGLEEAPKAWHVGEAKTANTKSFKELAKHGVEKAKPMHWAQMQTYMHLSGMQRALYLAVCKDTDELHIERVHYHEGSAMRILERAQRVIAAEQPPERIGEPDDFRCKFCHFAAQCHGTEAPLPGCRTCAHSTPVEDGKWRCEFHGVELSEKTQQEGCKDHRYIPALLSGFAELVDYNDVSNIAVWHNKLTSQRFSQPRYTSMEIRQASDKRALGVNFVEGVKDEFGVSARIGWKEFPDDLPWLDNEQKKPGVEHAQLGELYRQ